MPDRFVIPAESRRVRIPARGFAVLPAEGDTLPDDVWLRRRLEDGDVVEGTPAPAPDPAEDDPSA